VSPDKTDADIMEFAKLISELKNRRTFDFRKRRIAELEALDSFLVSNDYLQDDDIRYFTTLYDFWAYGSRQIRKSGTRFSAGVIAGLDYRYNNYLNSRGPDRESEYGFTTFPLSGGVELRHEKPISLAWQNSILINAFYGVVEGDLSDKTNSDDVTLKLPHLKVGFSNNIGYYPNTRTDINFTYSFQYVKLFDEGNVEKKIIGIGSKGFKASTDLAINYYISPRFRLNLTSSLFYVWQDSEDMVKINFQNPGDTSFLFTSNSTSYYNSIPFRERELQHDFRVGLLYSIF
jgi:hypothetical protein